MDEFPLCGHMVSDEYEQLSSEGESVSRFSLVSSEQKPELRAGWMWTGGHVSSSSELCWLSPGVFLS